VTVLDPYIHEEFLYEANIFEINHPHLSLVCKFQDHDLSDHVVAVAAAQPDLLHI
jgi:hypothetical protein